MLTRTYLKIVLHMIHQITALGNARGYSTVSDHVLVFKTEWDSPTVANGDHILLMNLISSYVNIYFFKVDRKLIPWDKVNILIKK